MFVFFALNALFRTNIEVAPCEMELKGPRKSVTQHLDAGEMRLTKEELLLEERKRSHKGILKSSPNGRYKRGLVLHQILKPA